MSIEVIKVVKPEIDEPVLKAKPESDTQIQLSVVVPAYREGRRIFSNLTRLVGELDKLKVAYEIVVVSDGNTDDTVSEAGRVASRADAESLAHRAGEVQHPRRVLRRRARRRVPRSRRRVLPDVPAAVNLVLDHSLQVQRAGQNDDAENRHAHRDFVTDKLGA